MASVANTARMSARIMSRYAPRSVARRGFQTSAQLRSAQNYAMPALSPTMTEGNIAGWKVKEGDSFSAGDVLLEIETDKATMDVEAQDDGILMKITMPDGSKGVKVGQRIGVMAEPGDDISSLELPADESSAQPAQSGAKEEQESSKVEPERQDHKAGSSQESSKEQPAANSKDDSNTSSPSGKGQTQKYPLYPSVEHLLHQNGLSAKDADQIPASGPSGRLLKGDVLAYLGKINKEYPAESSARLKKLSHLDLSNIELAPKPEPKQKEPAKSAQPEAPKDTEIALPISLSAVLATQKRVKDTLGIHIPLATFIIRASTLANDDLPVSKSRKPTADDLFNAVLGLDKVAKTSTGQFFPDVIDLSSVAAVAPKRSSRAPDIIDMLAPKKAKLTPRAAVIPVLDSEVSADRVFTVVAKNGDESRAAEYLERMKFTLEEQPGQLVLS